MADHTAHGQADHRAVEVYERLARLSHALGVPSTRVERLITALVMEDAARRWWTMRGYDMTEVNDADQVS